MNIRNEASGATPIPLQAWIQRATSSNLSLENYLETAVGVALELTNRLCLIVETNGNCPDQSSFSSSFSSLNHESLTHILDPKNSDSIAPPTSLFQLQLNDVASENVILHIADDDPPLKNITSLKSVDIQSSETSVNDLFDIPQLSSRDVCSALGAILFELFSKGQPLFMLEFESSQSNLVGQDFLLEALFVGEDDDDLFNDPLVGDIGIIQDSDEEQELRTNNGKRSRRVTHDSSGRVPIISSSTPMTMSNKIDSPDNVETSKSMKAKSFLREQCGLPLSVSRLVSDLLGAGERGDEFCADSVFTYLEEARIDMIQMKTHPHRFLHDRTCPSKALADTALFQQTTDASLYGRGREVRLITNIAKKVATHVSSPPDSDPIARKTNQFLCEAAFLSGRSGCGKSSVVKKLLTSCNTTDWLLLTCKFDRQVAPMATISKSFNNFFEQFLLRQHPGDDSFGKISQSITSSVDTDGFSQLCEIVPVFSRLFPKSMRYTRSNSSSSGNVGSGRNRLHYLFHILLKSLFSAGKPVLIALDDLQWSDGLAMEVVSDGIQTVAYESLLGSENNESQKGLFLMGSYRDNEADSNLLVQIQAMNQIVGNVKLTQFSIGELSGKDINKMLSFKLGLPMRSTRQLSEAIFQKTRGHPLFVIEFLRSIISREMLLFSVKACQWTWDDMVLDLLDMSEDVAEFLAQGLGRLDKEIIDAMKVCSCLGLQVDECIIELLDFGQFVPNMMTALQLAIKEGLMEKAGSIYAFSHDMFREMTYELIPEADRKPLHKEIGLSLGLDPAVAKNAMVCSLAVDQINVSKDILDPVERSLFARLNLAAGKHSMTSSSYNQARRYFEAGISLLHTNHWEKQYALCLELYELSVVVSFMDGNVENVSSRLDAILSNAQSFQDTLKARGLHLKVIASGGDYAQSTSQCLAILAGLGEHFPENVESSFMVNEITATDALLKNISKDHILNLPPMKDTVKLYAMRFLSMLHAFSMFSKYDISHLSSCSMVKLTLKFGFCEESIHGFAAFSRALLLENNDIEGSSRIGSLAESMLVGHSNEYALRAKLASLIHSSARIIVQPWHAILELFLKGVKSGMIVGDVENSCFCRHAWFMAQFHTGSDLKAMEENGRNVLRHLAKHKQYGALYGSTSMYDTCINLIGCKSSSAEIKTNIQLCEMAKMMKNHLLLGHVNLSMMLVHFYRREYMSVLELHALHEAEGVKQIVDFFRVFIAGISAMSLARDTAAQGSKMQDMGEKSTKIMTQLCHHSSWNFENKLHLLQAELHYLNEDIVAANTSYTDSIASARAHKFLHEEALACELHGIFLIENKLVDMGLEQLKMSACKYTEWGADMKVKDVISLIELVEDTSTSDIL